MVGGMADVHEHDLGVGDGDMVGNGTMLEAIKGGLEGSVAVIIADTNGRKWSPYLPRVDWSPRAPLIWMTNFRGPIFVV